MLIRTHHHDDLIGMVKICYSAAVKPLSNAIKKKSNLFSVYKKRKNIFKITVLPICGKIFGRVTIKFNQVFDCVGVNKLLSESFWFLLEWHL